jgi:hypothetical protein
MGKRIYITEEIADKLYQYDIAPIKDLPSDIKNVLKNHKTSLGQHPSFPPEEEISFDLMIAIKRFEEVRQKALDLNLETYSIKSIEKKLQDIIEKCKEIESNFLGCEIAEYRAVINYLKEARHRVNIGLHALYKARNMFKKSNQDYSTLEKIIAKYEEENEEYKQNIQEINNHIRYKVENVETPYLFKSFTDIDKIVICLSPEWVPPYYQSLYWLWMKLYESHYREYVDII